MKSAALLLTILALTEEPATRSVDSPHLVIRWRAETASAEEVEQVRRAGEAAYELVARLLSMEQPSMKFTVILEGDGRRSATDYRAPYVDSQRQLHLYRYPQGGYTSPLAHELVHAFRLHSPAWKEGFFEEALASYISDSLQPPRDGFPLYRFPLAVVVGQWIERGEDIPLDVLRERHRELNLPCKLQSYTLRSSFFLYLATRFGREKLFAFAASSRSAEPEQYQAVFGKTFRQLQADWRKDAFRQFRAHPHSARLADEYRNVTRAIPVCSPERWADKKEAR